MKVLLLVLILIILTSVYLIKSTVNADSLGIEVRDKEGRLVISTNESPRGNPFEFGIWAFPILATNLILLVIGVLYYKKRLPNFIKESINFVFNFEVSQKTALIILVGLFVIFIGFKVNEIPYNETWGDYPKVLEESKNWYNSFSVHGVSTDFNYLLLFISLKVFGNIRIIPFVASISMLALTYFITVEISKKRFAGIISVVILLQSNLFLQYATSATYNNFWTLFYILSLYLIYKRWYLSPVSYILSLFSKPLTAFFLPLTFFFIYNSQTPKKKKLWPTITYGVFTILFAVAFVSGLTPIKLTGFHNNEFWTGFAILEIFLRFDGLILTFLIPLIIGLFISSRRGTLQADSIMVLIMGIILSAPFLTGFTDLTNQPYRLIPLVIFFAIGIGTLLGNKTDMLIQGPKKNHISIFIFISTLTTVTMGMSFVIFPALMTRSLG
jgi:hypothetical protein